MNDVIRQLPDSVANQIAAGEVIQSPASVVKELVENAVDAGATNIDIIIKDAGRTLIQVIDNGCGMTDTDARMAFEKHATSKIWKADDLYALHTMGFRGEALASIAAVAQVDLRTMRQGETIGTRILLNGAEVESQEPTACRAGSNMMVKNLFFNIPARRKFLKKDSVELSNILREFERLTLVNPGINFTFTHNDTLLHQLIKGSLKQRIVNLFGKTLDKQLIPLQTETSLVRLEGFVSLPQFARRRNPLEYFFVNGRNMRHPYFHKAVMTCYEELIPNDQRPNYFINFIVDPGSIDVNIHPTKNEIKFENESAIWQILVAAIKETLGRFNAVPAIDFDTADMPEIQAFGSELPDSEIPQIEIDRTYNPFASTSQPHSRTPKAGITGNYKGNTTKSAITSATTDWEKLYSDFSSPSSILPTESLQSDIPSGETVSTTEASSISPDFMSDISDNNDNKANYHNFNGESEITSGLMGNETADSERLGCIQLKNKYIVASSSSGLMIIDQHRAHVRVLYDRYIDLARLSAISSQRIMFPELLRLSPAQNAVMEMIQPELIRLGFDVSCLGDNTWSLNGAPSVLGQTNPTDPLLKMIDQAANTGVNLGDDIRRGMALMMARAVAVKSGTPLSQAEMDHLLSDLFKLSSPNYTPDGKLIISRISIDNISPLFN